MDNLQIDFYVRSGARRALSILSEMSLKDAKKKEIINLLHWLPTLSPSELDGWIKEQKEIWISQNGEFILKERR